ncbi:MAG TPA: adenylate/guanylate cyclase domain-containing protein [Anaerolineaceae bacterium]|nr:adenylate/guanylate cyclase domain-containing protein [Anaerolineaceae bacterium]
MNNVTIPSDATLSNQVFQLSRQVDQMVSLIFQARPASLPGSVYDGLSRLSATLAEVAAKVKEQDAERQNLRALAGIGEVVNSSLELDVVLRIVMDTLVRLTGAERGFLMLRNETGELTIRIARNWEQESIQSSDAAFSRTIINRVAQESQPVLTTNAQEDPRFEGQESVVAYNLRSVLCVPLMVKDRVIGVIYADNRIRSGIFTEVERDLLVAFANQAAVAIENAGLFASVNRSLAEVTELKNLMDNIFASIASGVITSDIEANITLCNRAAESILDHPAKDLVGRRLDRSIPGLSPFLTAPLNQVLQSNQPIIGLECSPELPNRGTVDLRFNLSPLVDAQQTTQGVAIVLDDLTEKKRLEAQRRLLERMVSPAVLAQIDPDSLQLGGHRAEITVLFADIRGFTSFSEGLDPERLVAILNRHIAAAAEAVLSMEGTIDKFLGDAIMAWFNAPVPQADHVLRAVHSAVAIRSAIQAIHKDLPPHLRLSFGVGIHCGEAVLGWMGTERRLEYTAIGDCINTAKRIQENAAGGEILITADCYQRVKNQVSAVHAPPILAKGKREPLRVYRVNGLI